MSSPTPITPADLAQHTEQALIELVYVRTANDMLGDAMASLESALSITSSVLNILQGIQNLHNLLTVTGKSGFTFSYADAGLSTEPLTVTMTSGTLVTLTDNISAYQVMYNIAASAYYGTSIDPTFIYTSTSSTHFSSSFIAVGQLQGAIATELARLKAVTSAADQADANSLYSRLKTVASSFATIKDFTTFKTWALDSYNLHASEDATKQGAIQNDITFAITAAQSLNDKQKEEVRRFLFIFQEYYQSATAVLSKISQLIEQMAQKIAQ